MIEGKGGAAWIAHLQAFPHGDVHPEAPCVGCGSLTTRRAVLSVTQPVGVVSDKAIRAEGCPWCAACEWKRNRAQAKRIVGNPAVLVHVQAEAEAYLQESEP